MLPVLPFIQGPGVSVLAALGAGSVRGRDLSSEDARRRLGPADPSQSPRRRPLRDPASAWATSAALLTALVLSAAGCLRSTDEPPPRAAPPPNPAALVGGARDAADRAARNHYDAEIRQGMDAVNGCSQALSNLVDDVRHGVPQVRESAEFRLDEARARLVEVERCATALGERWPDPAPELATYAAAFEATVEAARELLEHLEARRNDDADLAYDHLVTTHNAWRAAVLALGEAAERDPWRYWSQRPASAPTGATAPGAAPDGTSGAATP
jgi:hypothetical protein